MEMAPDDEGERLQERFREKVPSPGFSFEVD